MRKKEIVRPTIDELEGVVKKERYKRNYFRTLRSTINTLLAVSAIAVLVAVLLLPVLQIYGSSMSPTLTEGDIVISVKSGSFETGEIVAFYYNNKILVKRVIGQPGDWIDIKGDGAVYVNGVPIEEPYVTDLAYGECDLEFPYQVPESRIFVMGDHRSVSVDSRSTTVGCIAEEMIVGKIVFRVWPIKEIGLVS